MNFYFDKWCPSLSFLFDNCTELNTESWRYAAADPVKICDRSSACLIPCDLKQKLGAHRRSLLSNANYFSFPVHNNSTTDLPAKRFSFEATAHRGFHYLVISCSVNGSKTTLDWKLNWALLFRHTMNKLTTFLWMKMVWSLWQSNINWPVLLISSCKLLICGFNFSQFFPQNYCSSNVWYQQNFTHNYSSL